MSSSTSLLIPAELHISFSDLLYLVFYYVSPTPALYHLSSLAVKGSDLFLALIGNGHFSEHLIYLIPLCLLGAATLSLPKFLLPSPYVVHTGAYMPDLSDLSGYSEWQDSGHLSQAVPPLPQTRARVHTHTQRDSAPGPGLSGSEPSSLIPHAGRKCPQCRHAHGAETPTAVEAKHGTQATGREHPSEREEGGMI